MFNNVKVSELEQAMRVSEVNIIDCREEDEYEEGHIPGSILVPTSQFMHYMHQIDKSKHYYIICLTGSRSQMVARYLDNQGYNVTNVVGGMIMYRGEIEV
ncbi:MAG: rhodanese-like domain-containing protein [Acholeplasmataceae bacterium]|jgi:rhodanese-related sulfurtransferase|nr:rhodanese-like domain-containing protein [Acholeplasmataceae bacterium]